MKTIFSKPLINTAIHAAFWISLSVGTSAGAQEEEADLVLEEVMVSAQRRLENLLDVPIAVTVFDAQDIEGSGIFELSQLDQYIPNVFVKQNSDFHSWVVIRGVGAHSRNIGFDTRVGVYLDGVYMGQSPAVNQAMLDLDHIEVLRGPQGTLFGKNSVAGAVVMVSRKPEPELSADVSVNVYNYDGLELKLGANIPLGDWGAVRFNLYNRENEGFVTNVFSTEHLPTTINVVHPEFGPILGLPLCDALGSGSPPGCLGGPVRPNTEPVAGDTFLGQDIQSGRVQLSLWLSEQWDIILAFDGLEGKRGFVYGDALSDTFGSTIDRFAPDVLEVSVSEAGVQERELFGASATIDFMPGNDHRFKSITAFRDTEQTYVNDSDASAFDYVPGSANDRYEQFSQELQWISPDDQAFTYLVGLYYFRQDASTSRLTTIGNAGWVLGVPPGLVTGNYGDLETRGLSAYFNGSYNFDEHWTLGFGFRYATEDKDTVWHLDSMGIPPGFNIGQTPPGGYIDSISEDNFSPTLHVSYMTPGGTNLYARYASGFKSGGFNLDTVSQAAIEHGLSFDQETVDSYEIGLKGYYLEDRLFVRAAVFVADYQDYQVNQFVDLGFNPETGIQVTSIRINNAAEVDTQGLELEAQWVVNDRLTLDGFLGLLDAKFADFPGGTTEVILDPDFPGGIRRVPVNAAGKRLPQAPDVSAGLGVNFEMPVAVIDSALRFRLDVLYTGDYFTMVENEKIRNLNGTHPLTFAFDIESFGISHEVPFGHVDAATTLNGRISLLDINGRWEVSLWGRNLTDEGGFVDYQRDFLGALWATPRTPRMYGIKVAYYYK